MTMAPGPERIHPVFLDVFRDAAQGLTLEPAAERLITRVLARGSAAFTEAEADAGFDLDDAAARLRQAMQSVGDELRGRGVNVVDGPTLSLLMQEQCPLPPFCYGSEQPAAMNGTFTPSAEATTREPQLVDS